MAKEVFTFGRRNLQKAYSITGLYVWRKIDGFHAKASIEPKAGSIEPGIKRLLLNFS